MRHGSQPTANRPPHLVASYDTQGGAADVFYPDVPTGGGGARPVVAHFHDYADREDILTKARENRDDINIRVSAQYPDGVREKRKHLYQVQKRYSDESIQTKLKG